MILFAEKAALEYRDDPNIQVVAAQVLGNPILHHIGDLFREGNRTLRSRV